MKTKLLSRLVLLFAAFLFCENASAQCKIYPRWQKLMDSGKYDEALKLIEGLESKNYKEYYDFIYRNGHLCQNYYAAEAAYKLGNLDLAVKTATSNFFKLKGYENSAKGPYRNEETETLHKFVHWAIELGEKNSAAGKIDEAIQSLDWAASAGNFTLGKCVGYPVDHGSHLAELLGDAWAKKGNYKNALAYYQALSADKYSPAIGSKIADAKVKGENLANANAIQAKKDDEAALVAQKNREELAAKKKVQDEIDAKQQLQQQETAKKQADADHIARTVRMYDYGNTSIKINDSKENLSNDETLAWLKNSSLAFSENGEELYFQHPTDKYYQIWNVATKEKVSEITFAEAGNTPKGREIIAAFPNVFYRMDTSANSKIWLSADTNISFDSNNKFTISDGQNQAAKSFKLQLRRSITDSQFPGALKLIDKSEIVNTRYQIFLHKQSNKLFIVANADSKYKAYNEFRSYPYCGIFNFDLNTNTLNILSERLNCSESDYHYTTDKWYFSNDFLLHYWGVEDTVFFRQTDLATATSENMKYALAPRKQNYIQHRTAGWDWTQHIGTDRMGNSYINDPRNDNLDITGFEKLDKSKKFAVATILNSNYKRNAVHFNKEFSTFVSQEEHNEIMNVMAVSRSGKDFAYISINNRPTEGNYASICLYNVNEKDRVYTLNDQTKYKPYLAKGYVTNKEGEDLAIKWEKERELGKQQRVALYKPQLDALDLEIENLDNQRAAKYPNSEELFKQKRYYEALAGTAWDYELKDTAQRTTRYSTTDPVTGTVTMNSKIDMWTQKPVYAAPTVQVQTYKLGEALEFKSETGKAVIIEDMMGFGSTCNEIMNGLLSSPKFRLTRSWSGGYQGCNFTMETLNDRMNKSIGDDKEANDFRNKFYHYLEGGIEFELFVDDRGLLSLKGKNQEGTYHYFIRRYTAPAENPFSAKLRELRKTRENIVKIIETGK